MFDHPVFPSILARRLGFNLDIGLGTLRWVREKQWRKDVPVCYWSDRKQHAGLSIFQATQPPSPAERVPVLFGTSVKKSQAVLVRGISEEFGPEYRTYFIHISPQPAFAYQTFDQENLIDDESGLPPIRPNRYKPRVNDEEMTALVGFLERNDLR